MKVALLHNLKPADGGAVFPDDLYEEYDSEDTIAALAGALRALGPEVVPVPAERNLCARLEAGQFDFVFNIAEGSGRRCREAVPAAACEMLGLPYTGSDVLTLAVTLDKSVTKRVVSPDVPVARGVLIACDDDHRQLGDLAYPLIVKPNDEGSSKGIRGRTVLDTPAEVLACCRQLHRDYGCPVLVEEFLPGTEVTVGVIGNGARARVVGMMEVAPAQPEHPFVYSLEVKRDWRQRVRYHVPPRLPAALLAGLERLALTAYRLLGCRDYARMDFRLDAHQQPRFLECNGLPGLNPITGDLVLLSQPTLPYAQLIQGILQDALARHGMSLG